MDRSYQGFYARFTSPTKDDAPILMGSDTLVGDLFSVEFEVEDGVTTAWLKNKFDYRIGYFDQATTRKLQLAKARDLDIDAILSFVAYDEAPDPGQYWGEVAIICTSPNSSEVFDVFLDQLCKRMSEGVRPDIDLNNEALDKVFEDPTWTPSTTVPMPPVEKGTAIIKAHRSLKEKAVEQGRQGNKGCISASIVIDVIFIGALIAAFLKFLGII